MLVCMELLVSASALSPTHSHALAFIQLAKTIGSPLIRYWSNALLYGYRWRWDLQSLTPPPPPPIKKLLSPAGQRWWGSCGRLCNQHFQDWKYLVSEIFCWVLLFSVISLITKTLGSTSIRYRSDAKCRIDADLRVFAVWENVKPALVSTMVQSE